MLKQRKGFTLIELLIVVVIIGILAAIAIPKFANTKQKAYITAMKSDLRNLVTSEEAYFSDSSSYTTFPNAGLKFNSSTNVSTPTVVLGTGTQAGGWQATVSHSQMPSGFVCGVGVNMPNPTVTTAAEGEPACK
jgi:prepilin-type N-terminal cleavage/methylation domain-containing protein